MTRLSNLMALVVALLLFVSFSMPASASSGFGEGRSLTGDVVCYAPIVDHEVEPPVLLELIPFRTLGLNEEVRIFGDQPDVLTSEGWLTIGILDPNVGFGYSSCVVAAGTIGSNHELANADTTSDTSVAETPIPLPVYTDVESGGEAVVETEAEAVDSEIVSEPTHSFSDSVVVSSLPETGIGPDTMTNPNTVLCIDAECIKDTIVMFAIFGAVLLVLLLAFVVIIKYDDHKESQKKMPRV